MKKVNVGLINKPKANSNFAMIPNEICQSETLSPEEKTILIYLLSLPSDWAIYKTNMYKKLHIGRDRFNSAWKNLSDLGYIKSEKLFNPIEKTNSYKYEVNPLPKCRLTDSRLTDSQSTDSRLTDSQCVNKDIEEKNIKKEIYKKEKHIINNTNFKKENI